MQQSSRLSPSAIASRPNQSGDEITGAHWHRDMLHLSPAYRPCMLPSWALMRSRSLKALKSLFSATWCPACAHICSSFTAWTITCEQQGDGHLGAPVCTTFKL